MDVCYAQQKYWFLAVLLNPKPKILISACLLGEAVRYDGGDCLGCFSPEAKKQLLTWQEQGLLLALCPEIAGGLPVPRPPAEIQGKFVKNEDGTDVTLAYNTGAQAALELCRKHNVKLAILKQGSPSCGNSRINDGTFSHRKIDGQGITARLLMKNQICVFNERQIEEVQAFLAAQ